MFPINKINPEASELLLQPPRLFIRTARSVWTADVYPAWTLKL